MGSPSACHLLLAAAAVQVCFADVYLHMPRGSNNRVNEQNTNRNNNNRLFDSQNNNKGGYSVGVDDSDYTDANIAVPPRGPILDNDPAKPLAITTAGNIALAGPNGDGYRQPPLEMELKSVLPIEWTNQHACGPNDKTLCEAVIQYMCDATDPGQGAPGLRDGEQTGCPNNNDQCPPLDNDNDITGEPSPPPLPTVRWHFPPARCFAPYAVVAAN